MESNEKHEVVVPLVRAGVPNRNGVVFTEGALRDAAKMFSSRNLSEERKREILQKEVLQLGARMNVTMEADGVTVKSIDGPITFNLIG